MSLQPISPQSEFQELIWNLVRGVPSGHVVTYGQLAKVVDVPSGVSVEEYKSQGARWVGTAMAACPDNVPWQRVVNAKGSISERQGSIRQQQLLEDEGIEFANGRLDLSMYQWRFPGEPRVPRQGRLF